MAEPTLLPGQDDPDIRLFTELGGGRLDAYGVEWLACDPYPTWYRWAGKSLIQRERFSGETPSSTIRVSGGTTQMSTLP